MNIQQEREESTEIRAETDGEIFGRDEQTVE